MLSVSIVVLIVILRFVIWMRTENLICYLFKEREVGMIYFLTPKIAKNVLFNTVFNV